MKLTEEKKTCLVFVHPCRPFLLTEIGVEGNKSAVLKCNYCCAVNVRLDEIQSRNKRVLFHDSRRGRGELWTTVLRQSCVHLGNNCSFLYEKMHFPSHIPLYFTSYAVLVHEAEMRILSPLLAVNAPMCDSPSSSQRQGQNKCMGISCWCPAVFFWDTLCSWDWWCALN